MRDIDHEYVVVSFILRNDRAILKCRSSLKVDYFSDSVLRAFYKLVVKYCNRGQNITFNVLEQILDKKKPKQQVLDVFYRLIEYNNRDVNDFQYSIRQMLINYKKRILISGVTDISQEIIGDDQVRAEDALVNLARVIQNTNIEGDGSLIDVRSDAINSFKHYMEVEKAAESDDVFRIKTGINYIDNITGGAKRGELWIWGGHTSEGKTHMAKEIAYRTCTEYKNNVLFVSLEMSIEEMKNVIEARHSHKFIDGGLLTKKIELGALDPKEKKVYKRTLKDFKENEEYGNLILWSPPYGCTVGRLASKMEEVSLTMRLDLVVVDYGELLALDKYSNAEMRIQVKQKMEQLKDLARTFNDNQGVWIFTPHQISRKGKQSADKRGYYLLSDLAESAGVERTANLVGWNLVTPELADEGKVRVGISKYRTGSKDYKGCELMADWAHSIIDEIEEYTDIEDVFE